MKNLKIILLLVVIFSTALACSLTSGGEQSTGSNQPASNNNASSSTQNANTMDTDSDQPGANVEGESYLPDIIGLPGITLLTPTENAGVKPLFEWSPVEGADWYSLVLTNSEGKNYWAWMGSKTSIYLGGTTTQPDDNAAGPILQPGMTWAVIAYDADGKILAASHIRPISP